MQEADSSYAGLLESDSCTKISNGTLKRSPFFCSRNNLQAAVCHHNLDGRYDFHIAKISTCAWRHNALAFYH